MPGSDIIAVGASAVGVEALRTLVGGLPKESPGPVFVLTHAAPATA